MTARSRKWALLAAGSLGALTLAIITTQVSATSRQVNAAVQPCSNGLIAMTFDDGPNPTLTPSFIDVLLAKRVPATFFVVGDRAAANPDIVRRAYNSGFAIGNHTWSHQHLLTLSDGEIADSLVKTQRAIEDLGATPSGLMRPPWGETDDRVLAVVRRLGLTQTLWDVGTLERDPATSADIVPGLIDDLRPGGLHIALMHDWSAQSLTALPTFVDAARDLGYCFAKLGSQAQVLPPVPTVDVHDDRVYERSWGRASYLEFVVTLSEPTSRATSVRVRTVPGTASPYTDYAPRDFRLQLPVGVTRAVVRVRVLGDNRQERDETLTMTVSAPLGLRLGHRIGVGKIIDND